MNNSADVIIVGAGVGGLCSAYQLLNTDPSLKITILEKANYVGGRVKTLYQTETGKQRAKNDNDAVHLELGASLLSVDIHKTLLPIMKEIGFRDSDFKQVDYDNKEYALRHPFDPEMKDFKQQIDFYDVNIAEKALVKTVGEGLFRLSSAGGKLVPKSLLRPYTIGEFSHKLLSDEFSEFLQDSLGYDTPFYSLNAADGINEIDFFIPKNGFLRFKPGLSTFISTFAKHLEERGVQILLGVNVVEINKKHFNWKDYKHDEKLEYIVSAHLTEEPIQTALENVDLYNCNNEVYIDEVKHLPKMKIKLQSKKIKFRCSTLVLALPASPLMKLLPNFPLLKSVIPVPLMRIYVEFDDTDWLKHLPPVVISSGLVRQFIQMSDSVIQIYVDNGIANLWLKELQKSESSSTRKAGNKNEFHYFVQNQLQQLFPQEAIPLPVQIYTNYCSHATHMWKKGVNSSEVLEQVLQPFLNEAIFVAGESYSHQQGWLEGPSSTSIKMVEKWKQFQQQKSQT